MKKKIVSIILPAYNERENLLRLIPAILAEFSGSSEWNAEILVVDDDSQDGTADVLRKRFSGKIRLIVRKHERGLASAIAEGIRQSRGSTILGMDADGNHDPRNIPALLSGLRSADLVVGSRFVTGGGMMWGIQCALSLVSNLILFHVFRFPVRDNTSGYYVIGKKRLTALGTADIYQGYGDYHLRLVWLAKQAGLRIGEVPVRYAPRLHGQSKSRLSIMLITYIKTVLQLRWAKR